MLKKDNFFKNYFVNSKKYSGVDEVDILIYFRGLGEWIDGEPYLIPKDAKYNFQLNKIN